MTAPHAVLEEVSPARKAEEPGPRLGRRRIGGPVAPVEIRDLSKHALSVNEPVAGEPLTPWSKRVR